MRNKQIFTPIEINRTAMKFKLLLKIIILILPSFCFQLAPAQVSYNNMRVKKEINNILTSRQNIDSIHLQFFRDKPSKVKVYKKPGAGKKVSLKEMYYYDLFFEGDKPLLTQDFPSIKKLLDEDVAKAIEKPDSIRNFRLVVAKNYAKLRDSVPVYWIYARIPEQHRKDLEDFLNLKYSESPVSFGKDSILLFQGEVDRGGNLDQIGLLIGNKGVLYAFFFDNYAYYIKNVFGKTKPSSRKSFILPGISGGRPWRALIDIYVRINPDNTIFISSSGIQRRLRIENYKKNESEPLFWW